MKCFYCSALEPVRSTQEEGGWVWACFWCWHDPSDLDGINQGHDYGSLGVYVGAPRYSGCEWETGVTGG